MKKGIVLKQQKGLYTVETESGERAVGYAASKIRKDGIKILAGDVVFLVKNEDGTIFITEVDTRKNAFIRPPVANVDTLVLVVAAAEPEPDLYNIDAVLAIAEAAGVKPVIVFNKTDLAKAELLSQLYKGIGYKVFEISAIGETKDKTAQLFDALSGICAFTGQSGVGKSTLLNALFPDLQLQTGEVSERIRRGKNTTRHTELFALGDGLYLADTPGFGSLDFLNYDILDFEAFEEKSFSEILRFKKDCKFRGCSHLKEQGCAVIAAKESGAVPQSRYESYAKLKEQLLLKESRKYE